MIIPIYNYLNQFSNYHLDKKSLYLPKNNQLNFHEVKLNEFPIYKLFIELDKTEPSNIIKFNVGNEFAVDLFKKNLINYTDIYKIVAKISSLNLNYKLNNIKDILKYHELLERKINEKKSSFF